MILFSSLLLVFLLDVDVGRLKIGRRWSELRDEGEEDWRPQPEMRIEKICIFVYKVWKEFLFKSNKSFAFNIVYWGQLDFYSAVKVYTKLK